MYTVTVFLVLSLIVACNSTDADRAENGQNPEDHVTTLTEPERSGLTTLVSEDADETQPDSVGPDEEGRFKQIGVEQGALIAPTPSTILLLNDTRRRYDKDDELNLHLVLAQDPETDSFLEAGFWTLYYGDPSEDFPAYQDYQRRVLSVTEHFGEWNGYFYTADHNGNGIEELIGFQLAGCCFAPEVWEYSGGAFHQVLDVSQLSDNMLAIEIPGPGEFVFYGPNYVTGDYLRFAFEWDPESGLYELTEQREVMTYPAQS